MPPFGQNPFVGTDRYTSSHFILSHSMIILA